MSSALPTSHVAVLLDRTDSLSCDRAWLPKAWFRFQQAQRELSSPGTLTLLELNAPRRHVARLAPYPPGSVATYLWRPWDQLPPYEDRFIPLGATGIRDAWGDLLTALAHHRGPWFTEPATASRVLVAAIVSRWEEPLGTRFTTGQLFDKFSEIRKKYGWQGVYLGGHGDAPRVAESLGLLNLSAPSTAPEGMVRSLELLSAALLKWRQGGSFTL